MHYTINLQDKNQNILVTGGSGFIGSTLVSALMCDGHSVTVLTRDSKKTAKLFKGPMTLIETLKDTQTSFDVIINLAGAPIMQRWNEKNKNSILNSRLEMTAQIVDFIKNATTPPKLLISGSAIGIYGTDDTKEFTEAFPISTDTFTGMLCKRWEEKAKEAENYGTRVIHLRTGIVLGLKGGSIAQMLLPFKLCLGGKVGSGQQVMSWIDLSDMLGIIQFVINNSSIQGAINATAPYPVSNEIFTQTLAKVMSRPSFLTMPSLIIKLLFGKGLSEELILEGQYVVPKKLIDAHFTFKYTRIEDSLNHLLGQAQ